MPITIEDVRDLFKKLENGDSAAFFEHIAEGKIAEVRAYLDSALVARFFKKNPITN